MTELPKLSPVVPKGISVIVPVRNQEPALAAAVAAWVATLDRLELPHELLVTDDGSSDATPARLAELAARHGAIRTFHHDRPLGTGAAVRTALTAATQPLVLLTGLDYPYQTGELRKLLDRIDEAHVVAGVRTHRRPPAWAVWGGRLWRGALRVLFGMPSEVPPGWYGVRAAAGRWFLQRVFAAGATDHAGPFKLVRREIFEQMPLQSDGDFFQAELLAKATSLTCYLVEVPLAPKPGPYPAVATTPAGPGVLADGLRLFFRPKFNRRQPAAPPP